MNGVLKASVSAGSSQRAARVTCRPYRISPSAANVRAAVTRRTISTATSIQVLRTCVSDMARTVGPGAIEINPTRWFGVRIGRSRPGLLKRPTEEVFDLGIEARVERPAVDAGWIDADLRRLPSEHRRARRQEDVVAGAWQLDVLGRAPQHHSYVLGIVRMAQDFVGFGPIQPDGYAHVGQTSPIESGAERRSQEDGRLDSRVPDERPVGDGGRRFGLAPSPADPGVGRLFATIRSELGEVGLAAGQDQSRVTSSRHADDTNPRRVDNPPEDGMRDHGVEHSLDVARSAEELGVGSVGARVLEVVAWVHGRRDDEAVPGQVDCRVVMAEVGPAGAV